MRPFKIWLSFTVLAIGLIGVYFVKKKIDSFVKVEKQKQIFNHDFYGQWSYWENILAHFRPDIEEREKFAAVLAKRAVQKQPIAREVIYQNSSFKLEEVELGSVAELIQSREQALKQLTVDLRQQLELFNLKALEAPYSVSADPRVKEKVSYTVTAEQGELLRYYSEDLITVTLNKDGSLLKNQHTFTEGLWESDIPKQPAQIMDLSQKQILTISEASNLNVVGPNAIIRFATFNDLELFARNRPQLANSETTFIGPIPELLKTRDNFDFLRNHWSRSKFVLDLSQPSDALHLSLAFLLSRDGLWQEAFAKNFFIAGANWPKGSNAHYLDNREKVASYLKNGEFSRPFRLLRPPGFENVAEKTLIVL